MDTTTSIRTVARHALLIGAVALAFLAGANALGGQIQLVPTNLGNTTCTGPILSTHDLGFEDAPVNNPNHIPGGFGLNYIDATPHPAGFSAAPAQYCFDFRQYETQPNGNPTPGGSPPAYVPYQKWEGRWHLGADSTSWTPVYNYTTSGAVLVHAEGRSAATFENQWCEESYTEPQCTTTEEWKTYNGKGISGGTLIASGSSVMDWWTFQEEQTGVDPNSSCSSFSGATGCAYTENTEWENGEPRYTYKNLAVYSGTTSLVASSWPGARAEKLISVQTCTGGNTTECSPLSEGPDPDPDYRGSCSADETAIEPGEDVVWTYNPDAPGEACFAYECAVSEPNSPVAILGSSEQCDNATLEPGPAGCDYGAYFKPICQLDACTFSYSWSGTDGLSGANQSVAKTYTTVGTKTASVTVTTGNDQDTIVCLNSVSVGTAPQCSDGIDNDTDTLFDLADPGCEGDPNGDNEAFVQPPPPLAQCADGINNDGVNGTDYPQDPGCTSPEDDNESTPPPILTFTVSDRVRPQGSATITWSTTSAKPSSCTVTGNNTPPDQWSGNSGSQLSSPLTNETSFTLRCIDLADNATSTARVVKIAPSAAEE